MIPVWHRGCVLAGFASGILLALSVFSLRMDSFGSREGYIAYIEHCTWVQGPGWTLLEGAGVVLALVLVGLATAIAIVRDRARIESRLEAVERRLEKPRSGSRRLDLN